jgi:hypothetical protein
MGISRLDAWAIQVNEVYIEAWKKKDEEKYGMAIYLVKDREIDRLSISTNCFPYGSKSEAETAGIDLVNEIRRMDIGHPGEVLEQIVGEDARRAVTEIVSTSRSLSG